MTAAFVVTGFDDVIKALEGMAAKVQKQEIKDEQKKAMKPMLAKAKQYAPVKTGTLKKYIKQRAMKKSRTGFGQEIGIGEKDFQGKAWYGPAVEYGTSKMKPRGFMRRAWDEGHVAAANAFEQGIKRRLGV